MEFSPEKIKKVAKLAKVKLSEEEITIFNNQFVAIAQIITKLQKVNTSGITPIHNPSPAHTTMRKDIVTEGNCVKDVLFNSPKQSFNCFVVPKVVE